MFCGHNWSLCNYATATSNGMKNILITTGIFEPDIGGPASYAKMLADKLTAADNYSVTILTYSSVRKFSGDKEARFKVIRIWKKIPKILRYLIYFFKIFFNAKKCDVILSLNAVSAGVPAFVAAKLRRKKFVVRIAGDYAWETAVNSGKTGLLIDDFQKTKHRGWLGLLHKLQTAACRHADGIIVPSEYLAGVVRGWGIDNGKITVIYNSTDFKPAELSREEARNKINIHGNILISVGRLVPWKGFRMLIKIMPRLLEINQFFRLVIIGDGPEKKILETMRRNLGLEKKVFITGKKSKGELAVYLAAADIFVLNTGYEGFSHQLLEAMSAGVPIITTAAGGNKEIIRQGENGFMVKYNDEFNLIEAVKTLWKMPELREQFVEEGRKTVRLFNADNMLKETVQLLSG